MNEYEEEDLRQEFPREQPFRCREHCIGDGKGGHAYNCPECPDDEDKGEEPCTH